MRSNWLEKTCVVGLGAHARTKLIPALQANGQRIVAAVSSQCDVGLPGAIRFAKLDDAVRQLPRDVAFVVSSPPAQHFEQVRTILTAGHDVFVEKPAFTAAAEAEAMRDLATRQGAVLLEGFMHRNTGSFERLCGYWADHRGDIVNLKTRFLVPESKGGTFRDQTAVASSIVFDICSYPVSLLCDLGRSDAELRVVEGHNIGSVSKERLRIDGQAGALAIDIEIGMAETYQNWVELFRRGGESLRIQPFYFGRKADRTITLSSPAGTEVQVLHDENAFERMFRMSRKDVMRNQASHLERLVAATGMLEALGGQLLQLRGTV